MKKRIILSIAALLVLAGCAGIQVSTAPSADGSKAYRHGKAIGAGLALAYPDQVAAALPYMQGLYAVAKDGTITDAQVAKAMALAAEKLGGNAALKASIAVVTSEIGLTVKTGTVNPNLVDALQGAIDGISAFKEVKT
jgi:hypothetical protein